MSSLYIAIHKGKLTLDEIKTKINLTGGDKSVISITRVNKRDHDGNHYETNRCLLLLSQSVSQMIDSGTFKVPGLRISEYQLSKYDFPDPERHQRDRLFVLFPSNISPKELRSELEAKMEQLSPLYFHDHNYKIFISVKRQSNTCYASVRFISHYDDDLENTEIVTSLVRLALNNMEWDNGNIVCRFMNKGG